MRLLVTTLLVVLALAGCKENDAESAAPDPIPLTADATGHFCQMNILEHEGPKGQIHLAGYPMPLWFSQVRDGLAYVKSPEQNAEILVFYVNDMGEARDWATPGIDNWIDANHAYFVVGSDAVGGMGAPEMVPFSSQDTAKEFAHTHGGEVMRLDDIPLDLLLAPIEIDTAALENAG